MIGDLIINGVDMATKGIEMGPGFIDTLQTHLSFKEDLENESSIEHGIQVLPSDKYAARDVTLTFVVHGATKAAYKTNDAYLVSLLMGRNLTVKIKGDPNYYRLFYTGKNVSYAHSFSGMIGKRAAKFTEVNPNDRGTTPVNPLFSI